jgi:predicted RecB family nuclease
VAAECVERLLNSVLVDLYPVVMKGVRVGLPSYSLKALEALYFAPGTRSGIAGGGESVAAFVDYSAALATNNHALADTIKNRILHYNALDCVSTEALRDWLLEIQKT